MSSRNLTVNTFGRRSNVFTQAAARREEDVSPPSSFAEHDVVVFDDFSDDLAQSDYFA